MPTGYQFREHPEITSRFPDLHPALGVQAALAESNRCLNCFDAPCMGACPTHIDVPKFIKKIASGNLRGSAKTILDANVLAASCSRVCPVEMLCEGSCVLHHDGQAPIKIGLLQRYAMEAFYRSGGRLAHRGAPPRSERIACIGAGPASLAAAAELAQQGFQVSVFDKRSLPGGLNTYGVAEYKLSAAASLAEISMIEELGVSFYFDTAIDNAAAIIELEETFDAIFLGVGLGAMQVLAIPGRDHPAVIDALRFIENYKMGITTQICGVVVVVGAGNTAIDAAVAAKRLGASEVSILYRRNRADISAFELEYRHALSEGVRFEWLVQPVAIHTRAGQIESVECARMRIGEDGILEQVDGARLNLPCDLMIPAIGQSPLVSFLSLCRDITLEHGRVQIDRLTGRTANPKYFAGGDCVNGGREVVDAVADGKRAALGIAASLETAHA